ncbi:hypothetical protein CHS0354_016081 [Potamilus streckersoni]|uniref:Armadillo repeat-containing domain-containing protein n=1 Tax=Potamilus streckersoni TaxID=2493646 RepID=A0AAE0T173_9BIVA|nr:hypothetical protein CHS0354_016081 [Potamilus streckersoni]
MAPGRVHVLVGTTGVVVLLGVILSIYLLRKKRRDDERKVTRRTKSSEGQQPSGEATQGKENEQAVHHDYVTFPTIHTSDKYKSKIEDAAKLATREGIDKSSGDKPGLKPESNESARQPGAGGDSDLHKAQKDSRPSNTNIFSRDKNTSTDYSEPKLNKIDDDVITNKDKVYKTVLKSKLEKAPVMTQYTSESDFVNVAGSTTQNNSRTSNCEESQVLNSSDNLSQLESQIIPAQTPSVNATTGDQFSVGTTDFQEQTQPSTHYTEGFCRSHLSTEEMNIRYQALLDEISEASKGSEVSNADIVQALSLAQAPGNTLTMQDAKTLLNLMMHCDPTLKHNAVLAISRCAAFTTNQNVFREHGCLKQLIQILDLEVMAMRLGRGDATTVSSTINAVSNLAVNSENQKHLEACVPTLVDISLDDSTDIAVCLSSLQALTNLSVTDLHHGHYTHLVGRLYHFLDIDNGHLRLQSLRILVNLSCNPDMVPHLLAAKAPSTVLKLLELPTDEAVILRWATMLANVLYVVNERHITSSSLPPSDKAPSPETMYTAILGVNNVGKVKSKVFLLCKHLNKDIRAQAAKAYNQLSIHG